MRRARPPPSPAHPGFTLIMAEQWLEGWEDSVFSKGLRLPEGTRVPVGQEQA